MKKSYLESRGKEYCVYDNKNEGGLDWSHLVQNLLLKRVSEGQIEEGQKLREEDVNS